MTKFLRFCFIFCILVITGCSMPPKQPTLTPLEIQTLQTRDYEHEKEVVFACYFKDGRKYMATTDSKTFTKISAVLF